MKSQLLAALVMLLLTGAVSAQGVPGGTSNPTRVEADATGPQDSVGTAGESPTKSMIQRSDKQGTKDHRHDGAGTRDARDKPASTQDGKAAPPRDPQPVTGK